MKLNYLTNYCRFCEFTDAPPQFHHYIAYWVLATALGRKVWMRTGDEQLFPNLWMVILAPSSFYRKSTSLAIGAKMLNRIDSRILLPADWTREGMIALLAQQPQAAMISYEFKSLMSLLQRDYNVGAQSILTELYDCPDSYIRKTGVNEIREFKIEKPHLSILGASTLDWLLDAVKGKDIAGGFLARFIFISATQKTKSYAIQPPSDPNQKQIVINNLQACLTASGAMTYTPEAVAHYERWYAAFARQCDTIVENMRAFFPRLTTYAHKFAMLEAIINHHFPEVTLDDCRTGCLIADNLAMEIRKLSNENIGASQFDRDRSKVIRIITENPGIDRRLLMSNSHLRSRIFSEVMDTVTETREVIFQEKGFFINPKADKVC